MAKQTWEEVNPQASGIHDFEKDDTLVGVYVARQENTGPNSSTLYHIQKKGVEGEKIGVWGNSVLNDRFDMIQIGEEVKIVYLGKETSEKTGRKYHNYKVYHRPLKEV